MKDIRAGFLPQDVIAETAQQIAKDFNMVGLAIEFPLDISSYQILFEVVFLSTDKLIRHHSDKFNSLLYRMDISEEQVKQAFARAQDQSFSHAVTNLIIKREEEKVMMRKRFSK